MLNEIDSNNIDIGWDALEIETMLQKSENTPTELFEALNESRSLCQDLKERIVEKEALMTAKEMQLKEIQRSEKENFDKALQEIQQKTKSLILSLRSENNKNATLAENKFRSYAMKSERKIAETESQLKRAEEKLKICDRRECELYEKVDSLKLQVNELKAKIEESNKELDSLKSVLELKQIEMANMRAQNFENQNAADTLPTVLMKVKLLEAKVDDLRNQLRSKCDDEKEILQRNKFLEESYSLEVKNRSRLNNHIEELQWKLKENSEKFSIAVAEFSVNSNATSALQQSIIAHPVDHSMENVSEIADHTPDFTSTPTVKKVVKKPDSVAWILDLKDEKPMEEVQRVVRRAISRRMSSTDQDKPQSPLLGGIVKRPRSQTVADRRSTTPVKALVQEPIISSGRTCSNTFNMKSTNLRLKNASSISSGTSPRNVSSNILPLPKRQINYREIPTPMRTIKKAVDENNYYYRQQVGQWRNLKRVS